MKKQIHRRRIGKRAILLLIVVSSTMVVFFLSFFERFTRDRPAGAFARIFEEKYAEAVDTLNLGFNSYYFAGAYQRDIYLGNMTAPLHVLRIGHALQDTVHLRIGKGAVKTWSLDSKLSVGSGHYTLLNRAERTMLRGNFEERADLLAIKIGYLPADFVPAGNGGSLVVRTAGTDGYYHLARYISGQSLVFPDTNVLERKVDGRFCVDGMLRFDAEHGKVLYAYYYRNQFICMDSLLNVMYRASTIDNNSYAPVKVASYNKIKTLAAHPFVVNKFMITGDSSIFIYSKARAGNESTERFETYDVVDVYYLLTGQYRYSLQLPNPLRRKLSSMYFYRGHLWVIYDRMLVRYRLCHIGQCEDSSVSLNCKTSIDLISRVIFKPKGSSFLLSSSGFSILPSNTMRPRRPLYPVSSTIG